MEDKRHIEQKNMFLDKFYESELGERDVRVANAFETLVDDSMHYQDDPNEVDRVLGAAIVLVEEGGHQITDAHLSAHMLIACSHIFEMDKDRLALIFSESAAQLVQAFKGFYVGIDRALEGGNTVNEGGQEVQEEVSLEEQIQKTILAAHPAVQRSLLAKSVYDMETILSNWQDIALTQHIKEERHDLFPVENQSLSQIWGMFEKEKIELISPSVKKGRDVFEEMLARASEISVLLNKTDMQSMEQRFQKAILSVSERLDRRAPKPKKAHKKVVSYS